MAVTRETLYDEVWAEPMTIAAAATRRRRYLTRWPKFQPANPLSSLWAEDQDLEAAVRFEKDDGLGERVVPFYRLTDGRKQHRRVLVGFEPSGNLRHGRVAGLIFDTLP
jgi:hypothetical protein